MFKLARRIGLAALASMLLAAPVAQARPSGDACFHATDIQGQKLLGHHILLLRVSGRIYRMDFAAPCDPNDAGLTFHPFANDGIVCRPIDVTISGREGGGMCMPTDLRRLTPTEVAAIPPKDLP